MPRTSAKKTAASTKIGWAPQFNLPWIDGELYPMLAGRSLLREMRKMMLMDETVGAMTWCIQSTLSQVQWKHVPQVDGRDTDSDPQAIEAAHWADTLLNDMDMPFSEHVEQALNMIWAGFAPCEIILKQRDGLSSRYDDKFYGIESCALRDPMTVTGWEYDERQRVTGMRQVSAKDVIPFWKLCNYRTSAAGNNPQGAPLFMNAWKVWRLKNRIQDSEAIGIERDLCGLPVFKVPMAVIEAAREVGADGKPTKEANVAMSIIANAQSAVRDMRFNRSGGLVYPSDTYAEDIDGDRTPLYDFKIITTAGQRSIDTRSALRDYDRAIARVLMMQFLHLGDRSSGSYGLSDDQSSMAMNSLGALTAKIATEFTAKAIKLVWTINGKDPRYMPRLGASDISKEGLTAIGTFLRGLGATTELWAADPVARRDVATFAGIKTDRDAQIAAAETAKKRSAMEAEPKQPTLPGMGAPADKGNAK